MDHTLRRLRAKNARPGHTWRRQVTPGVAKSHLASSSVAKSHLASPSVAKSHLASPSHAWRRQVTPGVAKSRLASPSHTLRHQAAGDAKHEFGKTPFYLTFPQIYLRLKFRKILSAGGVKCEFGKNTNLPDIPCDPLKGEILENFVSRQR